MTGTVEHAVEDWLEAEPSPKSLHFGGSKPPASRPLPRGCRSPKFCPSVISTGYRVAVHRRSAIANPHDRHHGALCRCDFATLLRSSQTPSGEPGSSSTTGSTEAQTSEAKTSRVRSGLLGSGAEVLVWMETGSHCCEPRNRSTLAQIWIRTLLACHLQDTARVWQKKDFERDTRSHIPDGDRESHLGRTAYSRGTLDARLRCLGKNHLPLDAPSA